MEIMEIKTYVRDGVLVEEGENCVCHTGEFGKIQELHRKEDEERKKVMSDNMLLEAVWKYNYPQEYRRLEDDPEEMTFKDRGNLGFDGWKATLAYEPTDSDKAYGTRFSALLQQEFPHILLGSGDVEQIAKLKGVYRLEDSLLTADGITSGLAQWVAQEAKLLHTLGNALEKRMAEEKSLRRYY